MMLNKTLYAHSLPEQPEERWQTLATHFADCAKLARNFVTAFNSDSWSKILGNMHDIGKVHPSFQKWLRLKKHGV